MVVRLDDVFAFFLGCGKPLGIVLEFIGMALLHRVAVNGLEFFKRDSFFYIEQLAVGHDSFHKVLFFDRQVVICVFQFFCKSSPFSRLPRQYGALNFDPIGIESNIRLLL